VGAIAVAAGLLAGCSSAALPGADTTLDQPAKAHRLQAEVDLRNAAMAQESYFAQHGSYTTDLGAAGFNPSSSTTVTVPQADPAGFCVQAVHADSGDTWHLRKTDLGPTSGPC
jgi:hypothetical protein